MEKSKRNSKNNKNVIKITGLDLVCDDLKGLIKVVQKELGTKVTLVNKQVYEFSGEFDARLRDIF